ncbi:MAG: RagB/SusD family nutrient uptake outer membrane protein [Niabella sp.]|nr:RagB/SusD family nutrient uptake outer membrane protein [Niabella sp.]
MKTIRFIIFGSILIATGVLAVAGCRKNFLDRTPLSSISDAEFWKTPTDMQLYVNNFYSTILPRYNGVVTKSPFNVYTLDADLGSDNMIAMNYNAEVLNGERVVPPSGGGWNWAQVRNVNYFLENYKRSPESFDKLQQFVGEALFFRAWLYFDLTKSFGDLPWINRPLTPEDEALLISPRVSRSIIVDSMIADLDRAIQYLPTKSKSKPNRVYKEVAQAFLSRVALFEGTWEKYHAGTVFGVEGSDGTQYLEKARAAAQEVISSGIFDLDNKTTGDTKGYWQLFNRNDYSNSKEVMFWRRYDPSQGVYNLWAGYGKAGMGRGLTKNLVDYYLCTDGQPIALSKNYKGDATVKDAVTKRDPRLSQTICVNDGNHTLTNNRTGFDNVEFKYPSFNAVSEEKCATGYQLYKGSNPDYTKQVSNQGDAGLIFFRYAEVLLNLAEAKAELGTISQADLDATINQLRDRVKMPHLIQDAITTDPDWEFPALSAIVNEVRRERRVELACEGFRHDDIWRWAAADQLILSWKPLGALKAQWAAVPELTNSLKAYPVNADGYIELYQNTTAMTGGYQFKTNRDYLLPIPLDQMLLANYSQNPNW